MPAHCDSPRSARQERKSACDVDTKWTIYTPTLLSKQFLLLKSTYGLVDVTDNLLYAEDDNHRHLPAMSDAIRSKSSDENSQLIQQKLEFSLLLLSKTITNCRQTVAISAMSCVGGWPTPFQTWYLDCRTRRSHGVFAGS